MIWVGVGGLTCGFWAVFEGFFLGGAPRSSCGDVGGVRRRCRGPSPSTALGVEDDGEERATARAFPAKAATVSQRTLRKSRSRFPLGMTARKANANAEADSLWE